MTRETAITISDQTKVRTSLVVAFAVVSAVSGAVWGASGIYNKFEVADERMDARLSTQAERVNEHEERLQKLESTQADIRTILQTESDILRLLESRRPPTMTQPHSP